MTRLEAVQVLERLQEPEAWEPQITHEDYDILKMAIDALKMSKVLADILDGCPLTQPCDKLWKPDGWCKEHCKDGQTGPDSECWVKYAEVIADDQTGSGRGA